MRLKRMLLALLAVLAVLAARSRAAALDWPEAVDVGQLLVLEVPAGLVCQWTAAGTDYQGTAYEPAIREFPGALVIETRYAGTITVGLKTDAKRGVLDVRWAIFIGDQAPEPPPGPEPPPPPGEIFAVLIEETAERLRLTEGQRAAVTSSEAHALMKARGYQYRVVDIDVVDADGKTPRELAPFILLARNHQAELSQIVEIQKPPAGRPVPTANLSALPRLIIANSKGAVLYDQPVVDEATNLAALKRFGGN